MDIIEIFIVGIVGLYYVLILNLLSPLFLFYLKQNVFLKIIQYILVSTLLWGISFLSMWVLGNVFEFHYVMLIGVIISFYLFIKKRLFYGVFIAKALELVVIIVGYSSKFELII